MGYDRSGFALILRTLSEQLIKATHCRLAFKDEFGRGFDFRHLHKTKPPRGGGFLFLRDSDDFVDDLFWRVVTLYQVGLRTKFTRTGFMLFSCEV